MSSFAVPLAALLGAPDAAGPIRVLAISIAVMGVFAVPAAQLQRDFRQDALFRANLISFLPSSVVLILLAGVGGGAMAFAWSRVAGALAVGYVMLRNVDRKYWPGVNWSYVRPLLHFGLPLALANVLSQVLLNVDYVFVGRVMSTADVGLYMLAFTICTWPTALLGPLLNNMVLPAFSRLKRDGGELASALSYAVRTVMLIACPIAAFTCAFSTPLINTVYGTKWAAAGPVLSVLSLYGIVFVLGLLFANIIISTGRTVVLFAVQVAALLGLLPALAVGVHTGGLVGIGVAHILVISLITLPTYLAAVRKSTGVGPLPVLRAVVRPLSAAVMAVLVGRLGTLTVQVDALRLLAGGTVVAIVYVLLTGSLLVQLLPTRLRPAGATHRLLHLVVRRRIHEGGE
jgi:PST family polysaccharide transporter